MSLELPNPAIHREENFNDGLTALVIDRLRLGALHSPIFDEAELCPPNQLNGYLKWRRWVRRVRNPGRKRLWDAGSKGQAELALRTLGVRPPPFGTSFSP